MDILNELVGYLNIPADEVYTNNPTKITYNFLKIVIMFIIELYYNF